MSLRSLPPIVVAGATLGAALVLLGWFDYRAVRQELRTVVAAQATALHNTVAAAAQAQHAAAEQAEALLVARLLDAARLLRELDRAGRLSSAVVTELSARETSYRIAVFTRDGRREFEAGDRPGRGPGDGRGLGEGRGFGPGPPAGGARLAQRLLAGESEELVSPPHAARSGQQRVAAGVRRAGGGAIIINASSETARQLDDLYSLLGLLGQIARSTPALAYIVVESDGRRVADGPLAQAAEGAALPADGEQYRVVSGVRVLERSSALALGDRPLARLQIGMRLDEVERGERRTLVRTVTGVGAALGFAAVALAFVTLRRRFGALSEEHARAQDALRRRDRLAAMGELASTVAHEIRNPLNAIAMSAQRLTREYPLPPAGPDRDEAADLLGVIQRESMRINDTVEQFLEFARPRPLERVPTALGPFLNRISGASASLAAARGVAIDTQCEPGLHASLDPAQLLQALDNLVRNAIDASPAGGTVVLDASRHGGEVAIEVRDQGAGIPPDVLPRIFDLYFTTRAEGTGVGLAVAQQIVTAHGGTIDVETAPGHGTTMRVRIPDAEVSHG